MQKMFLEMFCSDNCDPSSFKPVLAKTKESLHFETERKKIFIDVVEKTFLRKVEAYLKLPLQKIFLKICRCIIKHILNSFNEAPKNI